MQPRLVLLDEVLLQRVIAEAYQVLEEVGVKVHSPGALSLLADYGARVDPKTGVARLSQPLVERALGHAPSGFLLYDGEGAPAVRYQDDHVHFDPGSAAVHLLDFRSGQHRKPVTADYVRFTQLTELLPAYAAASTAFICSDVAEGIGDLYRLYLTLLNTRKPVVTGAFSASTWHIMKDLLVAEAGSSEALASRPRAIFDVCPTPPLSWSQATCQNLMDCARHRIPAQLVSMPLAGSAAPVTLAGALVQHTAESLSGVVIHQLSQPGAPLVWGGAPAITDMRYGTTPMGAIETAMIDVACAQIGKRLGLPTHAYLAASDSKILDTQAGFESGMGALLAGLAGINMISGAGMLDFLRAQSLEKLLIDAEIIGMVRRLLEGIQARDESLGAAWLSAVGHHGNFLGLRHTRKWFTQEQFLPSEVIDRNSLSGWQQAGGRSTAERAHQRVQALLRTYQPRSLAAEVRRELQAITLRAAQQCGMECLPDLD